MFKVLVAEDKALIRKGIISMIHWDEYGCSLAGEAENGKEAIKMIRVLKPDIVLTDIKMPLIDGLKVLDFINENALPIKTIIISGYDNFDYAKYALKANSVDYILKPIHEEELNKAIAIACEHLSRQQLQEENGEKNQHRLLLQNAMRRDEYGRFAEFAPRLGLPIDCCYFCVAAICNKYADYDAFTEPLETLLGDSLFARWVVNQEEMEILFAFKSEENYPMVMHVLQRLSTHVDSYWRSGLFVGVSGVGKGEDTVCGACHQARVALSQKILHPSQFLFAYTKIKEYKFSISGMGQIENQMLDLLLSGNASGAVALCRERIQQNLEMPEVTIDSLSIFLTRLYCILLKCTPSCADGIQEEIRRINHLDSILACESIDDLTGMLYRYCALICTELLEIHNSNHNLISGVQEYLSWHFSENIKLKTLETIFHINSSYLSVLFKKEYGVGINRYLTQIRLDYAKQLLLTTDYKLNDISEKCGFTNYIHFTKMFKANIGLSPSEYRKTNKNAQ